LTNSHLAEYEKFDRRNIYEDKKGNPGENGELSDHGKFLTLNEEELSQEVSLQ
jgi:hypothetical protein